MKRQFDSVASNLKFLFSSNQKSCYFSPLDCFVAQTQIYVYMDVHHSVVGKSTKGTNSPVSISKGMV